MQLGLLDDAVRLYRECGRYDLLNRLYQAAGLWERALEVAETKDGINLSTTHQLYAQHLEKVRGRETEVTLQIKPAPYHLVEHVARDCTGGEVASLGRDNTLRRMLVLAKPRRLLTGRMKNIYIQKTLLGTGYCSLKQTPVVCFQPGW